MFRERDKIKVFTCSESLENIFDPQMIDPADATISDTQTSLRYRLV